MWGWRTLRPYVGYANQLLLHAEREAAREHGDVGEMTGCASPAIVRTRRRGGVTARMMPER